MEELQQQNQDRYRFGGGRQSSDIVEQRAHFVKELLLSNINQVSEITTAVQKQFGEISDRTIRYDIRRAKDLIKDENGLDIGYVFGSDLKRLEDMIVKHMNDSDYRQAREAMDSRWKRIETIVGKNNTTLIQQNIINNTQSEDDTIDLSQLPTDMLIKLLGESASSSDDNQTYEDADVIDND
ncbi:hypothetical protein OKW21_006059 [Catalinimonas alkaloidigena]|uniref:hypothetical protein n=1 Tax=Catalinimonas alkaloidigena TaxID=1075417 RepID=UPI002406B360|nr:hypothetical protein [Catalinimonas alkaloidigena]MDF9800796.1 hypothetical protein [Catalinimonas alkaloidigena]